MSSGTSWYCNIKPLPSDPVSGGNIAYVDRAMALGRENIELRTAEQVHALFADRDVRWVMFGRRDFPSRAVAIDKAGRWIRKMFVRAAGRD